MQCNAKAKSTGEKCTRKAMANGKCYVHGGATPKGVASPHFKTGDHSAYLPKRMLERYQQAQSDTELLSTRNDIALMDARIADLLSRVDTGEAGKAWKGIKQAHQSLDVAFQTKDSKAIIRAMSEMNAVIADGYSDYQAWDELQSCLEQLRRLKESERKRLVDMQQMVTAEQSVTMVTTLLLAIREIVQDRQQLTRIQDAFNRLMNQQPRIQERAENG